MASSSSSSTNSKAVDGVQDAPTSDVGVKNLLEEVDLILNIRGSVEKEGTMHSNESRLFITQLFF